MLNLHKILLILPLIYFLNVGVDIVQLGNPALNILVKLLLIIFSLNLYDKSKGV